MKKFIFIALALLSGSAFAGRDGAFFHVIRDVNPTMGSANYASGAQIDLPKPLIAAVNNSGGTGKVVSVVVVDHSGKASPVNFWLFQNKPTLLSNDHDIVSITDAAASTANFLGKIKVAASDYVKDVGLQHAVATVAAAVPIQATIGTTTVWVLSEAASTVTYPNANDLTFRFGIQQD